MTNKHRILATTLFLVSSWLFPGVALASGYDVSYIWHRQLHGVEQYRDRVAMVLGPTVARHLRIVQRPGLYGLIYYRNGSGDGARNVAKVHSRLLRSRGLEPAAPMKSIRWNFVGEGPSATATTVVSKPTTAPVTAAQEPVAAPASTDAGNLQHLTDLEQAVEKHIKSLRARGLITRDERTAWSVYDFTTGAKLVSINEDVQFQAASMIKPFFAVAFFHKVANGELTYGPESRKHMERMIQRSNNPSTNWILQRIGGPEAAQRLLTEHYPSIFRDVHIVEYIPNGGRTYRNKASASDYSRFLYALWNDQLPGTTEIRRVMSLPGSNRLYNGARAIPKGTQVYSKTGSTAHLCGDMGILVVKDRHGNRYPYTLIGVIEKRTRANNYTTWIRSRGNVIRQVSNIVYEEISKQHNLRS